MNPQNVLQGLVSIQGFFGSMNFNDIIDLVTGNKSLLDYIAKMLPAWAGGDIVRKIIANSKAFIRDFFELLKDENFQIMAFTAYMEERGLGLQPEEMYKLQAFQDIYRTRGYADQPIVSGAYQRMTLKMPGIDELPTITAEKFENDLIQLAKSLENKNTETKQIDYEKE